MVNLSRGFSEIASGRLHPGRVCRPVNAVPPFRVRAELRRAPAISSARVVPGVTYLIGLQGTARDGSFVVHRRNLARPRRGLRQFSILDYSTEFGNSVRGQQVESLCPALCGPHPPYPPGSAGCGGATVDVQGGCVARGELKTACVGVGVALGWPLANQQPGAAGHPRPTWSTSPYIHIDLVVLADRRTPPLRTPSPSSSPLPHRTSLACVLALLLRPRRQPPKKVESDQRVT